MNGQEQKNRRIGVLATLVWHGALLLFFLMFMAWTEPDPPIPEYGIEFNLGSSEISDVQSNETESIEQAEEVQDSPEESEIIEEGKQEAVQEEVVEEATQQTADETVEEVQSEPIETVDDQSPDTREEQPVAEKNDESTEETKPETQSEEVEKQEEGQKAAEKKEETPKIDDRAIYKGKSDKAPGGNKGASLDFSGWMWDFKPQPDDKSEESGRIVVEVTVDEEGEVLYVKKITSTVTPAVYKKYEAAVQELTFSRTAENRSVASTSKGRITFIIESK